MYEEKRKIRMLGNFQPDWPHHTNCNCGLIKWVTKFPSFSRPHYSLLYFSMSLLLLSRRSKSVLLLDIESLPWYDLHGWLAVKYEDSIKKPFGVLSIRRNYRIVKAKCWSKRQLWTDRSVYTHIRLFSLYINQNDKIHCDTFCSAPLWDWKIKQK